eukprot:TRINITY_DN30303_c0_g2_i1.p2 TRINITY_DN30303_c0_g2~~TRINITY_DN30303_c0_g2_i1.p2  ORF type:complete len:256 (+),score=32.30 TRINITY_DN30303_c0_g2_i1:91-768(+)
MACVVSPLSLSQHRFRSMRRHEARKRQDSDIMLLRLEVGVARSQNSQLQQQLHAALHEVEAWRKWYTQLTWNQDDVIDVHCSAFEVDELNDQMSTSVEEHPPGDEAGSETKELRHDSNSLLALSAQCPTQPGAPMGFRKLRSMGRGRGSTCRGKGRGIYKTPSTAEGSVERHSRQEEKDDEEDEQERLWQREKSEVLRQMLEKMRQMNEELCTLSSQAVSEEAVT